MRLTLRTMLAYLDDVLEPDDARELGTKIRESEFASGLVHRIRDCTQRLRLGAPKLEGKGIGLDPNTVAEYLDSTLPQDRVPDFEKVCLESDVHLAEVASCHQILAIVLGEPAEVSPAVRDRILEMYRSPVDADPNAPPTDSAPENVGGESAPPHPPSKPNPGTASREEARDPAAAPVVAGPSVDRAPGGFRSPAKTVLLTVAITFLVVVAALLAMGRFDRNHPLLGLFGSADQVASNEPGEPSPGVGVSGGETEVESPGNQPPSPVDTDGTPTTPGTGDTPDPAAGGETPPQPTPPEPGGGDPPSEGDDVDRTVEPPPPDPQLAGGETEIDDGGGGSDPKVAGAAADPTVDPGGDLPEPPDPGPAQVGVYITDEVLARFDTATDSWQRLPRRATLVSGDQLYVPPTYRPQVVLDKVVEMTFVGPTRLQLEASGDPAVATAKVASGRMLLGTVGADNAQIQLNLGGRIGTLVLANAESYVALEVGAFSPPGSNPEEAAAQRVVQVYVKTGQAQWLEEGEAAAPLRAGEVLAMLDDAPAATGIVKTFPDWLEPLSSGDIYLRASMELSKHLVVGRPLSLSLQESVKHRQIETRALAMRCLTPLGQFEPCLIALDDPRYASRTYWPVFVEAVRDAASVSTSAAGELRVAVETLYPERAAEVYELLCGYSPEQLQDGSAQKLVQEYLSSPELYIRVLALDNLRRITDRENNYRPQDTDTRRKKFLRYWLDDLAEGRIAYKTPPAALPDRDPAPLPGAAPEAAPASGTEAPAPPDLP